MLEAAGLFTLGILTSWWFMIAAFVIILIAIHSDSDGFGLFFTILLLVGAYNYFNIDSTYLMFSLVGYLPVGIAWSLYRWKRHCSTAVEDFNKFKSDWEPENVDQRMENTFEFKQTRENTQRKLTASKNVTKIVSWIINWPFSVIENVLSDVIEVLTQFVKKRIIGLYNKISKKYLDQLNQDTINQTTLD